MTVFTTLYFQNSLDYFISKIGITAVPSALRSLTSRSLDAKRGKYQVKRIDYIEIGMISLFVHSNKS